MAAAKVYTMDEKKRLVEKAIKEILKEEKSKCVIIYPYQIYDTIKNAEKVWKNEDAFFYELKNFVVDIPKYKKEVNIQEDWKTRSKCVDSIMYTQKPCKEFDSLNLYIANILKCKPLSINDVMTQNIAGKRSAIFERYNIRMLAHEPEMCKQIKDWCRKTKSANWKAVIEKKHDVNYGDRYNSYGQDMECQWEGLERDYIIIKFLTPSGKVKAEQSWYI